jgi:hypothetical protein
MKKLIIVFFALPLISLAQSKVNGYVSFHESLENFGWLGSNLSTGVSIQFNKSELCVLLSYSFVGNLKGNAHYQPIKTNFMTYNILGGELKYRILKKAQLYSPSIILNLGTDIFSSYRGKYLFTAGTVTNNSKSVDFIYFPSNQYSSQALATKNFTYYFVSIPFVGNIIVGNEFRLYDNLILEFGLGFNIKGVTIRYKEWSKDTEEPKSDISKTHLLDNLYWKKGFT